MRYLGRKGAQQHTGIDEHGEQRKERRHAVRLVEDAEHDEVGAETKQQTCGAGGQWAMGASAGQRRDVAWADKKE